MSIEDEFNTIAQKTLVDASSVQCDVSKYIWGLLHIKSEIEAAIEVAHTDLK